MERGINNNLIGVILARRDSKRLVEKHVQTIGGITLIRHAINKLLSADLFDHVILSTDCPKCIEEGRDAGIDVIERDPKLCQQESCMAEAFMDAVDKSVGIYGKLHRWGCLFQPTNFLVSTDLLHRMYKIISTPRDDNPRAHNSYWGAVITESCLYPWFYDLRPGIGPTDRKTLDYFDTVDEISVDIHNQRDLDQARILYQWMEEHEPN